ncbi:hypothetical protein TSAR_002608 [Trichomalopsis sarcophagae]|uniref:HCLS1-associated protein X-1 n=1 Tax=Trichomalopsis sarcophagae TaxID=543379 RepID=A0A232FKN4_9HYME|nr:hypothetical protein TSAR_002608 [Trichomalopsis sarcophagae]
MPFFEFFRNLFGKGPAQEPPQHRFEEDQSYRDGFRNPIWQTDDDEDDISDFSNRHPANRFQFRIFSDPFEMTRFFETQMDDMMRNFFGFGNGFGNNTNIFLPFGNENALPMPGENPVGKGPRDEVLKAEVPDSKLGLDDFISGLPFSDRKFGGKGPVDEVLKPSYEMPDSNSKKLDSDIDGKIKSDELAKIWKGPSTSQDVESFTTTPQFSIRSFGSSVSTQIVRRPDGSMEERRTVRDSDGNEEIKITRQIGDKMHTIITKRAKDGSEVKSEDIVNMDENELRGFDEKWTRIRTPPEDNRGDGFPWHKFFGPNPKL